jgi:hypothetical protein
MSSASRKKKRPKPCPRKIGSMANEDTYSIFPSGSCRSLAECPSRQSQESGSGRTCQRSEQKYPARGVAPCLPRAFAANGKDSAAKAKKPSENVSIRSRNVSFFSRMPGMKAGFLYAHDFPEIVDARGEYPVVH